MRFVIPVLLILLFVFAGKAYYDTNTIEVRHYEIKHSPLGELLDGLKVAHLLDLHIKKIGLREEKLLKILEQERPDLIFVTGDFISFDGPYEPALSFFNDLKPPLGTYAVLGNTEYTNENGSCILCHPEGSKSLKEKPHPVILRNASLPVRINGKILNIIGVDDPVNKKDDLKGMAAEGPSILLAHSPEIFEEASNAGVPLILSGHNHGGQIFLTGLLKKIIPLDPALEFLEGFFQKGKSLMYVSRGIGASYLPFRLGVKPEITFLTFTNKTNEKIRISRINPTAAPQGRSTAARPSWSISNSPAVSLFTGFSLLSVIDTFNIFNIFDSLGLTAARQHRSTSALKDNSTLNTQHSTLNLYDFESESDLERLNWECGKWFELSREHATSGKYSLKASLPPGQYPGINFEEIEGDWSKGSHLKMDVYNPGREEIAFHIRIDDHQSGWEYENRFDIDFMLKPGVNPISIAAGSIKTNLHHRPLNLKKIKRMMVFLPGNPERREIHIDHIRLQ
jgi:predicted MPP superfamily phosphohydrolase